MMLEGDKLIRNLNYKISILEKENERLRAERDALRRKLDALVPLLRAASRQGAWASASGLDNSVAFAYRNLPADVRALAEGGDDG